MAEVHVKSIVATILLLLVPYLCIRRYQTQKADALYAERHNCQPLKTLPYRWPLGLELLWAAYRHATEGHILRFFTALIQTVPPTFEQKLLGVRGIDTVDPKIIEAVLGSQFTGIPTTFLELELWENGRLTCHCEAFGMGDRPNVWYPLIGPGIFTQDGEDWKHSRDLLRPLFLSKRVDNFLEVQESVETLIKCIPDGKVVDFQPLFFRLTLDTTTYLLFGRSIRSLADENEEAEEFGEAFRISQDYLAHRGRLGPLHWMLNNKTFRDANAIVHKWIDAEIKEGLAVYNSKDASAEKRGKTDYGFLGFMMEETQEPKVLRDALLNVLLAGRDTTACLLTWTMRLLVKHENVMAKLREEIKTTVGVGDEARNPDRNDIKKMLYLSYVLKEVLRLYPSVPVNSRAAVKTTVLPTGGGPDGTAPVYVKKGTAVGYSVYTMHRRKELYGSDAEAFRPERWDPNIMNEVDLKNIGWGYLPFNGGPRVCIGQEFALLEASYAVIRLLQTFSEFEYDPTKEMPEVGQERQDVTLVLASGDGCWIRART